MKNLLIIGLTFLAGCQSLEKDEVVGLWELQDVLVDKMPRPPGGTYLQIHPNNSFSVSSISGDMSGVYVLGETRIHFQGKDLAWFNTTWTSQRVKDYLLLEGVNPGFRRTELKFQKVEQIPTFDEFESRIVGKWQMFLVMKDGIPEKMPETWMTIDDSGNYIIADRQGTLYKGRSVINTRHHKVIFENDNTHWSVWFWGKELRLLNERMGIQYHLRKG